MAHVRTSRAYRSRIYTNGCLEARFATLRDSLRGKRLHLNAQRDLHIEAIRLAGIEPELVTLERAVEVCSTDFALQHRMRHALELIDFQRNGLRYTAQRELPIDRGRRAVLEFRQCSLVGRRREFRDIEEV